MKRYDTYKPSGSRWIGDIPEHWELRRIRHLVKDDGESIKIGPFGSSLTGKVISDGDYKVYGQWNIIGKDFSAGLNTVAEETFNNLINYQIVEDDILISMMGTVGKCATIPRGIQKGIMDSHVIKIRLNQSIMKSDFFEYAYDKDNSNVVFPQIQEIKKGSIMDGLNSSLLKDFIIPVPPLAEQEAIAAYLDVRCADIDKVVATQQKRIALLHELKQSEITQAVTLGLNPDVRMKDSGVEWMGLVPEHWEVKKLKFVVSCNDDVLNDRTKDDQIIRYVEISDVNSIEGITNSTEYEFKKAPSRARRITKKDDVIVSTVRTYLKAIARVKEDGLIVSTGFAVLRAKNINPNFLAYSTLSELFIGTVISESVGVSYPAINSSDIINIKLPVPPSDEQVVIAEHLDRRCGEIDRQIGAVTRQIELLREYKQALITEVVTGKRKV